jgi:uncharacterized Zn-finger protein
MDDTISIQVSLPLDQGFLRRECPCCRRQFKINSEFEDEGSRNERICPYCGQAANPDKWMTREQKEHIKEIAQIEVLGMIDAPLTESFRGLSNIHFDRSGRRRSQPSLRPESDDMNLIPVPCCSTEMKIDPGWTKELYCFYCGARVR